MIRCDVRLCPLSKFYLMGELVLKLANRGGLRSRVLCLYTE